MKFGFIQMTPEINRIFILRMNKQVLVVVFLFISGVLPIGMTAVASDSMHPAFEKAGCHCQKG